MTAEGEPLIPRFRRSLPDTLARLTLITGCVNISSMIKSFKSKETEKVFNGRFSAKLPQTIQRLAARKLDYLDSADELEDFRSPPGNRLEALKDDRAGQYSLRINDQWRICFVWRDNNAYDVEIVDYH